MSKVQALVDHADAHGLRVRAWLTRTRSGWVAKVQCGQLDARWRRTGAAPGWIGRGATAEAALDEAAHAALHFWTSAAIGQRRSPGK